MAGKSKKRKSQQKRTTGQAQPAQAAEAKKEKEQAVVAAKATPPPAKEAKKPRPAKAAPVTTKKPSRFRFFAEAFNELRRAHWPSRREAIRLSIMVAGVCVVVGALLGALDLVFTRLVGLLLLGGS